MPRNDREYTGSPKQRPSQHEIICATARDDIGQIEPTQPKSDMRWGEPKPNSGPLSVKLRDLLQKDLAR